MLSNYGSNYRRRNSCLGNRRRISIRHHIARRKMHVTRARLIRQEADAAWGSASEFKPNRDGRRRDPFPTRYHGSATVTFPIAISRNILTATREHVRTRFVRGHPVRYWFKSSRLRNEGLDRRTYAMPRVQRCLFHRKFCRIVAPMEQPRPPSRPSGAVLLAAPPSASTSRFEHAHTISDELNE
jgi:hypothetical protein